jgi:hypothetical protein
VTEFVCVDGPLSGQGVDWPEGTATGRTLTIAMVDVGQPEVAPEDEPEADYRVERLPEPGLPGLLRFVAGRGPWRAPRGTEPLLGA